MSTYENVKTVSEKTETPFLCPVIYHQDITFYPVDRKLRFGHKPLHKNASLKKTEIVSEKVETDNK